MGTQKHTEAMFSKVKCLCFENKFYLRYDKINQSGYKPTNRTELSFKLSF